MGARGVFDFTSQFEAALDDCVVLPSFFLWDPLGLSPRGESENNASARFLGRCLHIPKMRGGGGGGVEEEEEEEEKEEKGKMRRREKRDDA